MTLGGAEFVAPITLGDYERIGSAKLTKNARDYYSGGADNKCTVRENQISYNRIYLQPRNLIDVKEIDTSCMIHGISYASPIGIAPTALHCMAHEEGEIATLKSSCSNNILMILSTWSTVSLENVANTAKLYRLPTPNDNYEENVFDFGVPNSNLWFQLYVYKDRQITKQLVLRAERAGYRALVVTVDTPVLGNRLADIRNRFSLPAHLRLANFDDVFMANDTSLNTADHSGLANYVNSQIDASITWADIRWLMAVSSLPVILKGILSPADALQAVNIGAAGIVVSNHGGRQLDTVPATIDVLPGIVRSVDGRIPVYIDGGIRRGTDVFKALALGARGVFIGRPVLWALACAGSDGISNMYQTLLEELRRTMALMGCRNMAEINNSLVFRFPHKL